MTKTNTLAAKLSVAFVAVAMVFTMFAPATQAQTVEELQAQIAELMAQINQLTASAGSGAVSSSSVCPYTWTRTLNMGATGADVMKLQEFLNSSADTQVAPAGSAGGPGSETSYYGPATGAAVAKFQEKHRMDILSPLGLVNATTFFGNSTMAKANSLCTSAPVVDGGDDDDATEDDDDDSSESVTLGGTAVLNTFEVDDASDTDIQEGDSDVEIGTFEVEFENGDAEISFIDIALVGSNANANPWDAFDTISLWVDGDMIAEVNADDEDDYLDEDDGTLRFSNLGLIAMEDEEVEIVVAASVQNNLDSEEMSPNDWDLFAYEMRYFDADGVATTEDSQDDLQDNGSGDAANFEIEEEGEGEELNISLAPSNPDSTDIIVDEDDNTDGVTIFSFDMEAEEGDIELDRIVVLVETDGASTTAVVDDVTLSIDGMTFDAENVESAHSGSVPSTLTSRFDNADEEGVWYVFDIDGDVVIDEDDEIEGELMIDFKSQSGNYNNGQQITASIGNTEKTYWIAEGADDLTAPGDFSGSAVGDDHTVVAEGIVVPVDGVVVDESTSGDNDQTGSFEIEFEVTAIEADFYVFDSATEGAFNSTTTGVTFSVDGPGAPTSSGVISSTADEDNSNPNFFIVREGDTETFTLTVTVDADTSGQHRVNLTGVGYSDDNVDGDADDDAYKPVPTQDFRTGYININAN